MATIAAGVPPTTDFARIVRSFSVMTQMVPSPGFVKHARRPSESKRWNDVRGDRRSYWLQRGSFWRLRRTEVAVAVGVQFDDRQLFLKFAFLRPGTGTHIACAGASTTSGVVSAARPPPIGSLITRRLCGFGVDQAQRGLSLGPRGKQYPVAFVDKGTGSLRLQRLRLFPSDRCFTTTVSAVFCNDVSAFTQQMPSIGAKKTLPALVVAP